jgi:hypothetical protein
MPIAALPTRSSAFADLVREFGGTQNAVLEWLWQLAIQFDKPIRLQAQWDDEVVFCVPPGWSDARLRRYLGRFFAGHTV